MTSTTRTTETTNETQMCSPHGHAICAHCYPDLMAEATAIVPTAERLGGITDAEFRARLLSEIDAMAFVAMSRAGMELLSMVNLTWVLGEER